MIQKIVVLSEENLEKQLLHHIPGLYWALISISGFEKKEGISKIKNFSRAHFESIGCIDQLFLTFGDFGKNEFVNWKKENPTTDASYLFNEYHAQKIIDFIKNLDQRIEYLIVQCGAGVSRSGAVGLFANRYLKLDEKEFRKQNSIIRPNEHVLAVLMQKSGLRDEYENFWKKYEKPNEKIRFINDL